MGMCVLQKHILQSIFQCGFLFNVKYLALGLSKKFFFLLFLNGYSILHEIECLLPLFSPVVLTPYYIHFCLLHLLMNNLMIIRFFSFEVNLSFQSSLKYFTLLFLMCCSYILICSEMKIDITK